MIGETEPVAPHTRGHFRRWYLAVAAVVALAGGYLFLGPLSPQDSGNSWTTFVLLRPVCDGLLTRDQVRQLVGTEAWSWRQTDSTNLTNYTCSLGDLEFSVARFPGPADQTGGLIGKLGFGSHPEPLGSAGTTAENLTWFALTCRTGDGDADQLIVSLDWGANEKAVNAFVRFASEVATRQGCPPPDIPAYRPLEKPRPQPLLLTEPLCGLVDPAQLGPLNGWTVTRSPQPTGPVNHCAASGPAETNKPRPRSFVISTFSGPFVGPGTQKLDFFSYTSVCRGTGTIYALKTTEPATSQAFGTAVQAQHNIRCTPGR